MVRVNGAWRAATRHQGFATGVVMICPASLVLHKQITECTSIIKHLCRLTKRGLPLACPERKSRALVEIGTSSLLHARHHEKHSNS